MGKSQRLKLAEVRGVYRLLGECRDLGADPVAWRQHLLAELAALTGVRVVTTSLGRIEPDGLPTTTRLLSSHGLEPDDIAHWEKIFVEHPEFLQSREADVARWTMATVRAGGTACLADICDRDEWYGSRLFNEVYRPTRVDAGVFSLVRIANGIAHVILLQPALGEPWMTTRQARLVKLLHEELAPLVGTRLAADDRPAIAGLPPRVRQTLACLLDGDSEKQVAARLRIGRDTVHQYVQTLYRHFDVSSRGELMAYFLRFHAGDPTDLLGG